MIIIDLMKIGDTASGRRLSTHCSVRQRGGVPPRRAYGKGGWGLEELGGVRGRPKMGKARLS